MISESINITEEKLSRCINKIKRGIEKQYLPQRISNERLRSSYNKKKEENKQHKS